MELLFKLLCWGKRKTKNGVLLGNWAASGNSLPTFWDDLQQDWKRDR